MADPIYWLISDDKSYLIEYLCKTPGGVLVSINGSEAYYLSIAADTGKYAHLPFGNHEYRIHISNEKVSLQVDGIEKPPLPDDLAIRLKLKSHKLNIQLGLVITLVFMSLINTAITLILRDSNEIMIASMAAPIIQVIYVLLHFLANRYDSVVWLSFGLIMLNILILILAILMGTKLNDIMGFVIHLPNRAFYVVVLLLNCRLAYNLFKLALSRKLTNSL